MGEVVDTPQTVLVLNLITELVNDHFLKHQTILFGQYYTWLVGILIHVASKITKLHHCVHAASPTVPVFITLLGLPTELQTMALSEAYSPPPSCESYPSKSKSIAPQADSESSVSSKRIISDPHAIIDDQYFVRSSSSRCEPVASSTKLHIVVTRRIFSGKLLPPHIFSNALRCVRGRSVIRTSEIRCR